MLFNGDGNPNMAACDIRRVISGLLGHVEEIESLCKDYPETLVVLDHFGFCKDSEDAWGKLLEWATQFPQVCRNGSDRVEMGVSVDLYQIECLFPQL